MGRIVIIALVSVTVTKLAGILGRWWWTPACNTPQPLWEPCGGDRRHADHGWGWRAL